MSDRAFIDTNVLVYAFASIKESISDRRTEVAYQIVAGGGAVSVQVLSEFVQVCRRKARLDWDRVVQSLVVIKGLCGPAVAITIDTHEAAVAISRRYGFHIYDSLIIAAAMAAGCTTLLTEDMQHGQVVEGVRIENPFLGEMAP